MTYVCEECREEMSSPDASRCPSCGHHPARDHYRWKWIHGVLYIICFLTIIGIPVALVFGWKARKHRLASERATPAVEV